MRVNLCVVHIYNPSTLEAEAGEQKLEGQPGLHSQTCLKNPKVYSSNRKKVIQVEDLRCKNKKRTKRVIQTVLI
jgi:hypothetical protein